MAHLVIIPTPIGNLGDMSQRAIDALSSCDIILCEDTRVCSRLLSQYNIKKQMITYRDDNELKQCDIVIDIIQSGKTVGLTSDAGTPAISDPGYRIVHACRKNNIPIISLPGPCAAITTLAASGLPTDKFLFVGFLPNKSHGRQKFFSEHKTLPYSIILYESCHRIQKFLEDACLILGDQRIICVAKEVTKLHESFFVGNLNEALSMIKQQSQKGEYTIVIAPEKYEF